MPNWRSGVLGSDHGPVLSNRLKWAKVDAEIAEIQKEADARVAAVSAELNAVIGELRNYKLNGSNAANQIHGMYRDMGLIRDTTLEEAAQRLECFKNNETRKTNAIYQDAADVVRSLKRDKSSHTAISKYALTQTKLVVQYLRDHLVTAKNKTVASEPLVVTFTSCKGTLTAVEGVLKALNEATE